MLKINGEKEEVFVFPPSLFPSLPLQAKPLQSSRRGGRKSTYRWVIPSPNPANRSADKLKPRNEKEHPLLLLPPLLLHLPLVPLGWSSKEKSLRNGTRTLKEEKKREREVSQCYSNAVNKKRKTIWFLKNRPKAKTKKTERRGGVDRGGDSQNPAKNLGQLHRTVFRP